jgi:hypothetical protein
VVGVDPVAPRQPPHAGVHGPAWTVEAKCELAEAHLEVAFGILQESVEVVRLDADAPFDCPCITSQFVAPTKERVDLGLKLGGPVRETSVPSVRELGHQAKRASFSAARDQERHSAVERRLHLFETRQDPWQICAQLTKSFAVRTEWIDERFEIAPEPA